MCLVQTRRIGQFPIVLFGKEFFEPLEQFFKVMLKHNYIEAGDLESYLITDDIDEAVEYINSTKFNTAQFGRRVDDVVEDKF